MGHQREVAPLETLRKMAQAWGGDILKVSQEEYLTLRRTVFDDTLFSDAPFVTNCRLGVCWKEKKVLYTTKPHIFEVIHEMGHVFACTQSPEESDEYSFLGWEVSMAHHLDVNFSSWVRFNRDYQVGDSDEQRPYRTYPTLGSLRPKQRKLLFQERIQVAEALGLLKNGVPLAIR